MSMGKIEEALIFPLDEIYYDSENIPKIIKNLRKKQQNDEKLEKVIEKIENYDNLESLYIYLPCIVEEYSNFIEFIKPSITTTANNSTKVKALLFFIQFTYPNNSITSLNVFINK